MFGCFVLCGSEFSSFFSITQKYTSSFSLVYDRELVGCDWKPILAIFFSGVTLCLLRK